MVAAWSTGLLVALAGVALVHTRSRVAGAWCACAWCIAAAVFGAVAFQERAGLVFVGLQTPPWLYFAFLGGLFVFNAAVIGRALRRARRDRDRAPGGS